jgi:Skp family chaperone for outer membrane proteins
MPPELDPRGLKFLVGVRKDRIPRVDHAKRKQGVLNVCIRILVISLTVGMSLLNATAQAQGTAQPANAAAPAATQRRAIPVAVIDLSYIIKNHPTMTQEVESINTQSDAVRAEFEKKRQSILKLMEELKENYTEGTPDYMRKEQEIAEQDTQFRLDVVRKNKEFDERKAQVFFEVHKQISFYVKFYCDNSGTFVVLQVARDKPDPKKPATIEIAMRQEVFFHQPAPDVDITEWVLQQLKTAAATPRTATPAAAGGSVNR